MDLVGYINVVDMQDSRLWALCWTSLMQTISVSVRNFNTGFFGRNISKRTMAPVQWFLYILR